MAKKSFRNPAKQFISNIDNTNETVESVVDVEKKSESAPQVHQSPEANTVPMKRNPLYVETKSKRLQLLMQPSLHQKIKEKASVDGVSVNEYIHQALERCIE